MKTMYRAIFGALLILISLTLASQTNAAAKNLFSYDSAGAYSNNLSRWNLPKKHYVPWKWNDQKNFERNADNVVIIESSDGGGTGVILGDNILTCAHIIEHYYSDTVTTFAGSFIVQFDSMIVDTMVRIIFYDGLFAFGKVVKYDHDKDLALIAVAFHPPARSITILIDPPKVGENIFAIGHPVGLFYSYSKGYVMSPVRKLSSKSMIQMSMTSYFGSSGSPVFNKKGELIGLLEGIVPNTGIAFAISSLTIAEFLIE